MIEIYLLKNKRILEWVDYLPLIIDTANKRVVNKLEISRYELHYNMNCNPLFDIEEDNYSFKDSEKIKDIITKRDKLKKQYLSKNNDEDKCKYSVGDIVYCPNRYKAPIGVSTLINPNCNGPYKIVKIQNKNAYLKNLNSDKYISEHITKLKKLNLTDFFMEIEKIKNIGDCFPKDQNSLTRLFSKTIMANETDHGTDQDDEDAHEYLRGLEDNGLEDLFQPSTATDHYNNILDEDVEVSSTPRYNLRSRAAGLSTE